MKATRTCSVDGCERKHRAHGMCNMHHKRWTKHGSTEPFIRAITSPAERLAAGLERKPNGCLEWTRVTNNQGYGTIFYQGKMTLAHRLAWTLANGPIPDGMCVCHKCDDKLCADVTHMFLGSHDDNMADMAAKGRAPGNGNNNKTHCTHGHPYDQANTHVTPQGHRVCRACVRTRYRLRKAANRQ